MATYRKRGSKWYYRIDIGRDPVTNKRLQPTISKSKEFPNGFNTKKEAQTAAAAHQVELDNGTHVIEKEMLFIDLRASWLGYYAKTSVKKSTIRVRKHESGHLAEYFKDHKAKNITKKMYQDALTHFKENEGLSDSTIGGIHSTGGMIFEYALKFDILKTDPSEYAKVHKSVKTLEEIENFTEVPKYLEKEELSLFLRTAKEHGLKDDYEMFSLLAYSGIRAGELCALKETDLNDNVLSITKTYYNPNNNVLEYELTPPKTTSSRREIDLAQVVVDALNKMQPYRNEIKMLYRKTFHDKGFIFINTDNYPGYPIYIKKVESRMRRLLKIAGLTTDLTPHSLRHTHTSLLAEAGVGIQEIMDRLGHKDDDVTKSVYMHVTKSMKKEASHKFEKLMENL